MKITIYRHKKFIQKSILMTEHVRILGYRQDALEILKCMDFYISSSLSEGLPISMLEAFAAEIPTIATEITGNKDILRNSVFGVLAESGSPKSISEGIVKMPRMTQEERDILTRNALNRIKIIFQLNKWPKNEFTLQASSEQGHEIKLALFKNLSKKSRLTIPQATVCMVENSKYDNIESNRYCSRWKNPVFSDHLQFQHKSALCEKELRF